MMFTKQINKRKTGAILMGLTLSLTGSVLAAPATDLDSRIAALEQEQAPEQPAEKSGEEPEIPAERIKQKSQCP